MQWLEYFTIDFRLVGKISSMAVDAVECSLPILYEEMEDAVIVLVSTSYDLSWKSAVVGVGLSFEHSQICFSRSIVAKCCSQPGLKSFRVRKFETRHSLAHIVAAVGPLLIDERQPLPWRTIRTRLQRSS